MYQGGPPTQAAQAAGPWMQPQPQPQPAQPYGIPMAPVPPKKNRNGLIAAVGIAAVVVIGGGTAIALSGGGSGGSSGGSGGTSGGTLGGNGGNITLTPIPASFPLSSLVTDADAAQYLHATPTASAPSDDSTDDPATFDKTWLVDSANTSLRVQAWNYKSDSKQAETDFSGHLASVLATDAPFQDEGTLGNSDKTEIEVSTDSSSGLQHCKIEILRGGLDVTVTFVESGSAAGAQTDVLNLAKLVTGRLPAK